jgi:enoyl-CoA hydratase
MSTESTVLIERTGRVVTARLNRPEALNALSTQVLADLVGQLEPLDADPEVGCFVLTGSEKAFAAGADIREMSTLSFAEVYRDDLFAGWERFTRLRTPKLAAVSGYALGGGCELAMMCDVVYAAENAKFGQPEITLGIIPGMGGTQRLTRLVGRSKALDVILTGRMIDAAEAERAGLVARVFPTESLLAEVGQIAAKIAGFSKLATVAAVEAVDQAEQLALTDGVHYERRVFHSLFATDDQKEGMAAFLDKRPPEFTGS